MYILPEQIKLLPPDTRPSFQKLIDNESIMFEALVGSRAQGLSTPESDYDFRGVYAIDSRARTSLYRNAKRDGEVGYEGKNAEYPDANDIKYYEVEKLFRLASGCNPNIIEILWTPKDCVYYSHPAMDLLLKNRSLFISEKARHTFKGYALNQISKAKGQNKWINNPQPEDPPKKEDFCRIIWLPKTQSHISNADEMPCRPSKLMETDLKDYHVAKLECVPDTYRLYYYGSRSKGVFRNGQIVCESIPKEDEKKLFMGILIYNRNEYLKAKDNHKNYWTWVKERNESRWIKQEDGLLDYDAKNMMHCLRILKSGINILEYGEPIVRADGEWQKFLMDVRHGEKTYEYCMYMADDLNNTLAELNSSVSLPSDVDHEAVDNLYHEVIEVFGDEP